MSNYEIYSFFVIPLQSSFAIKELDQLLKKQGAEIDHDCLLSLADTKDQEKEPEYITNPNQALDILKGLPGLGTITYWLYGCMITIQFKVATEASTQVSCINISIPDSALSKKENQSKFNDLARQIHDLLRSDRTLAARNLEVGDFKWKDELQRLEQNEYQNNYELDLRN